MPWCVSRSDAPAPRPRADRSAGRRPVGWREWVGLPQLAVAHVKAKVDTGARTSTLHAFDLEPFDREGRPMVRFSVHPYQRADDGAITCEAEVIEERAVRSSSGHVTQRPVIRTRLRLGGRVWSIELTLAARDQMGFRMLLGREAVRGRFVVDPGRSYVCGVPAAIKARRRARRRKA